MPISFAGYPQVVAMLYDVEINEKSSNLIALLYLIFRENQMNMDGSNLKPISVLVWSRNVSQTNSTSCISGVSW